MPEKILYKKVLSFLLWGNITPQLVSTPRGAEHEGSSTLAVLFVIQNSWITEAVCCYPFTDGKQQETPGKKARGSNFYSIKRARS